MSRLLKSSGSVGAATLISRCLGFAREAVYAGFMGIGPVADAFYYAYSIPSLFRRLLGEGALTAAFIPIFKDREKNQGTAEMWRAANARHLRAGAAGRDAGRGGDGGAGRRDCVCAAGTAGRADRAADVRDVSVPGLRVPGRGVHRHAERPRAFLHAGARCGRAERGDDRRGVLSWRRASARRWSSRFSGWRWAS